MSFRIRAVNGELLYLSRRATNLRAALFEAVAHERELPRADLTAADLGGVSIEDGGIRLGPVHLPKRSKQTQLLTGEPGQAAATLLEKLRTEARVL